MQPGRRSGTPTGDILAMETTPLLGAVPSHNKSLLAFLHSPPPPPPPPPLAPPSPPLRLLLLLLLNFLLCPFHWLKRCQALTTLGVRHTAVVPRKRNRFTEDCPGASLFRRGRTCTLGTHLSLALACSSVSQSHAAAAAGLPAFTSLLPTSLACRVMRSETRYFPSSSESSQRRARACCAIWVVLTAAPFRAWYCFS